MMNNEKALDTIGDLLEFAVKYAEQNDDADDVYQAWEAIEAARLFLANPEAAVTPDTSAIQEKTPPTNEQIQEILKAHNIDFSQCVSAFAEDDSNPYVVAGRDMVDGEDLQMDDSVVISEGEDGAYVLAWKFVSKDDAGISDDEDEDESENGESTEVDSTV